MKIILNQEWKDYSTTDDQFKQGRWMGTVIMNPVEHSEKVTEEWCLKQFQYQIQEKCLELEEDTIHYFKVIKDGEQHHQLVGKIKGT